MQKSKLTKTEKETKYWTFCPVCDSNTLGLCGYCLNRRVDPRKRKPKTNKGVIK